MSAERVAVIPECEECGAYWPPDDPERWRLALVDVDGLVWYCTECYEAEFGDG